MRARLDLRCFDSHRRLLQRIRPHDHELGRLLHNPADDHFTVVRLDGGIHVLFGENFRRFRRGFQNILPFETRRDCGQEEIGSTPDGFADSTKL